jgi:uncharacterized protein (DUF1778 family)
MKVHHEDVQLDHKSCRLPGRFSREFSMAQVALKLQRLEARITPAQKRLIQRAAELRGISVTAFVVLSAQEAAIKTISDHRLLQLRAEANDVFMRAILNPPEPNEAARAAAGRFKETMRR